jgi:hypothetical protein
MKVFVQVRTKVSSASGCQMFAADYLKIKNPFHSSFFIFHSLTATPPPILNNPNLYEKFLL